MKLGRILLAFVALAGALALSGFSATKQQTKTPAAGALDSMEIALNGAKKVRLSVAATIDSLDSAGWKFQASDDGTTWTTLTELTATDLTDDAYGTAGAFYVTSDSTGVWYLILPGSDVAANSSGVPGADLAQARLLAFATHLRWYLFDVNGTDVTGPSFTVNIRTY